MLYPTAKYSLNKQNRPAVQSRRLKNHDRILYVNGLFSPPKSQENTVGLAKESEEWSSLFTMVLITGFGAVMLLISIIGSYGILATNRLESHEQIARKQLGLVRTGEVVFYLPESTELIP